MDPFPSSPSSAWSCTHSRSSSSAIQDHLSPHTPDSYFFHTPAIVDADDFTFQVDVQLDQVVRSPHLLPHPSLPFLQTDPCSLSADDVSKAKVLMRNTGKWGRFDSPPPAPRPLSGASDDFYLDTSHSAAPDSIPHPDSSRCSLLIHEVSLLIGLTAGDDYLSYDGGRPLLPDAPKQAYEILPLSLSPTKSLACRMHGNADLPNAHIPAHTSDVPVPPSISPPVDNVDPNLHDHEYPPNGSRDPAIPIPRYKRADASCSSPSPCRRHGHVFLEPSIPNADHRNALNLDEMFTHPRDPPPKPTSDPTSDRCSSLDRLEYSLLKLEAYAPRNHRKSRSDGRPSNHVAQRKDRRPSLPPPRSKHQLGHETVHCIPSRPAGCYLPCPSVPRPMLPRQHVALPITPAVPLDEDPFEEDPTPSSFMDMDIPLTLVAQPKRRSSFSHVKGKEKVRSLVSVAKRVSRGVISWGKNLTGSTKCPGPPKETTASQSARV